MAGTIEGLTAGDRRKVKPLINRGAISSEDHGLGMVMGEITSLMKAAGAMLTMHLGSGQAPTILYADPRLDHDRAALVTEICRAVRPQFEDGRCFWREGPQGSDLALFFMPVEQAAGHGRLVITIVFDAPAAELRSQAEALYMDRRPFAIGYFHLWQANRALMQRARSLEAVLDHTAIGVLLLDRTARIIFANHTGEEILVAGDGLSRSNSQPRATNLGDGVNLQAALSHALVAGEHQRSAGALRTPLMSFTRASGPPLIAALLPSRESLTHPGDVAAIMYIVDPALDTAAMLKPLCRLYHLSPVETVLATHLATGSTIIDAAAAMRIKAQTARSYLKTIFVKTNTSRQTELVALLLSSLIRMKNDILQEALAPGQGEAALRRFE